jgi:aminomethyltransferase
MLISTDPSVKAQHELVRKTVGWYDFTHKLLEVSGKDAASFLDYVFVANIANLVIGKARYTTMLNEQGLIIDDVIVFHMADELYWVSTLYIDVMIDWFDAHKGNKDVTYENITSQWMMYSVQGPKATELVDAVVADKVDNMKFFTIADNAVGDVPAKVARSGYTGEKFGYEIYIAPNNAELLETRLADTAKTLGGAQITEVDVMAYTLAAEKGFILMTDVLDTNPFEVGFENTIAWDKDFIGKAALKKVRDEGPKRRLLGFTVDDDEARIYGGPHGAPVFLDGVRIGRVTKYTRGFTVGKNIGYALVDATKVGVGDVVFANSYPAKLTERQFI